MNNNVQEIKTVAFADTDEEAERRFKKYAARDPLPDVPPALLNSADILDYVAITGMIFPFHPELQQRKLKTASYEVDLIGDIIFWEENGTKRTCTLRRGDPFILPKNSIAFVTPEPTFRLPNYIAIRFNLKITNVHRGILLGTGPLVDPGYEGKLLIPLHNLTNNDYKFVGGEGFIWMEFTKLSPIINHQKGIDKFERSSVYAEFPSDKKRLGPEQLIAKALKGQNASLIQSSIPAVAGQARTAAVEAKNEVTKITKKTVTVSVISLLALFVALAGVIVSILIGNRQFINIGQENMRQIEQLKQEVKNQNEIINELRNSLIKTKSDKKPVPSNLPNETRKK